MAWGLKRGHATTAIAQKERPSRRVGKQSKRSAFVKSIVREVAGFAPYERRVMELIRNSKDKKARKLTKKRLGTLRRAKRKVRSSRYSLSSYQADVGSMVSHRSTSLPVSSPSSAGTTPKRSPHLFFLRIWRVDEGTLHRRLSRERLLSCRASCNAFFPLSVLCLMLASDSRDGDGDGRMRAHAGDSGRWIVSLLPWVGRANKRADE